MSSAFKTVFMSLSFSGFVAMPFASSKSCVASSPQDLCFYLISPLLMDPRNRRNHPDVVKNLFLGKTTSCRKPETQARQGRRPLSEPGVLIVVPDTVQVSMRINASSSTPSSCFLPPRSRHRLRTVSTEPWLPPFLSALPPFGASAAWSGLLIGRCLFHFARAGAPRGLCAFSRPSIFSGADGGHN